VVGQCGRYSIAEFLRSLAVEREYFALPALPEFCKAEINLGFAPPFDGARRLRA
jgi:hypothetical protein